ncbi:hypothetical protein NX801_00735 [Streptomyces sp. LP05-1]|uniref:Integral membrane protein n=1 Tax=Streptomyces pyxinae TaxID=2970734 RepID=A0ABT2C9Y2_9ACTN|nr:hypothetical protein [Streptomyces sp. LP05-1]MCS0634213.1 hypothetical protein [Streptomyces sp. LP05-1]
MTDTATAARSGGGDGPEETTGGRAPVHPSVSEAGRLMCAGTYLDPRFRDRVIEELYVHEERIAAPAYGFDSARVLAHALRARRFGLGWAALLLAGWAAGTVLSGGLLPLLLLPFLLRAPAGPSPGTGRGAPRLLSALLMVVAAVVGHWVNPAPMDLLLFPLLPLPEQLSSPGYGEELAAVEAEPVAGDAVGWFLACLLALAVPAAVIALRTGWFARLVLDDLAPELYTDPETDPAEANPGARFRRVRRRIRAEQHAPLILFDPDRPFCGAGTPYRPWHLTVELRPRDDLGPGREPEPEPVTNARMVERIVPLIEELRVPSHHGSSRAEAAVLDRLRELVVDECVFLPVRGLPHREEAPLSAAAFARHRADAIEEGGEQRRHFLRARVGGWDENLVVTVFVRVHTQGGMLMLEVAPYILLPLPTHFRDADARRQLRGNAFGKAVRALGRVPASLGDAIATLARGLAAGVRIAAAGHGGTLPEGPALSVRELAAQRAGSLFHLMDAHRYLRTIQERVVSGVAQALHEAGWHTEEFARRAVHVAEGGVYIQSVSASAFSIGGSEARNSVHGARRGTNGAGDDPDGFGGFGTAAGPAMPGGAHMGKGRDRGRNRGKGEMGDGG